MPVVAKYSHLMSRLTFNHLSIQFLWYEWKHGNVLTFSPLMYSDKHILQQSFSLRVVPLLGLNLWWGILSICWGVNPLLQTSPLRSCNSHNDWKKIEWMSQGMSECLCDRNPWTNKASMLTIPAYARTCVKIRQCFSILRNFYCRNYVIDGRMGYNTELWKFRNENCMSYLTGKWISLNFSNSAVFIIFRQCEIYYNILV